MKKRGISPVIATVLLISLAVILAFIVLFWARGFFTEMIEKNGKNIEVVCKEAKIGVIYEKSIGGVEIKVTNNGPVPISAIEVHEEGKETKKPKQFNVSVAPGMISGEVNVQIEDFNNLKQLRVYPALLGNVKGKNTNKFSVCLTNSQIIKKEDIL